MPRIDGWALKTGDFPSLPPQLSMETTPPLGGRGAMTPGRGRCSEHTRMASPSSVLRPPLTVAVIGAADERQYRGAEPRRRLHCVAQLRRLSVVVQRRHWDVLERRRPIGLGRAPDDGGRAGVRGGGGSAPIIVDAVAAVREGDTI